MLTKIKSLKKHSKLMKYINNIFWLFFEKIIRLLVSLSVNIWIARYLGPEQFGLLNYAISFVALFSAFASLGVDKIIIRELIKQNEKSDILLGTAFFIKICGAISVFLIILLVLYFTSNDNLTSLMIIIITSGLIFQSFNVIDLYFQSKVLSKFVVFSNSIALFTSSIIKIILLINEASLISFAIIIIIDNFILALGLIYFYTKQGLSIKNWKFKFNEAIALLRTSWPLMFTGLVIMFQVRIDQIMIKEIIGVEEVGHYSVAIQLIEYFNFMAVIINQSFFPSLLTEGTMNFIKLKKLYQLQFYLGVLLMIFVFFTGQYFVDLLYGKEYSVAGELFILSALRIPLTSLSLVRSAYITINDLFMYSLFAFATSALINVTFNYILIPSYHAKGAIIATIITSLFIFLIDFFYKKTKANAKLMMRAIFFSK